MSLTNPTAVERDNQNTLRKYPFSDAATCTNGSCVLAPGALIDAQLYLPGRTPGRVWLSSVDTDGRLHFSDTEGECAQTSAPMAPQTALPVTFTGDGGPIPGGVIVCGTSSDVAALRACGGQAFAAEQAELAPAAVSYPGLPGVSGFRLDDGNVVTGAVRFRGANGLDVVTRIENAGTPQETHYLRFSALGKEAETVVTTGFIKQVDAVSDNTTFAVANTDLSGRVIDIYMTGVKTLLDEAESADQDSVCSNVRAARGTLPSASGTLPPTCGQDVCDTGSAVYHTITLMDRTTQIGTFSLAEGSSLRSLETTQFPPSRPEENLRFAGYYDNADATQGTLYYRYDGAGVGKFTAKADVTLYAHWVSASSSASVTFDGYGTLHLRAPDDTAKAYVNPLTVSGVVSPVPTVTEFSDETLAKGGAETLSEIFLHPSVPSGIVTLGIRGLTKAYTS